MNIIGTYPEKCPCAFFGKNIAKIIEMWYNYMAISRKKRLAFVH